MSVPSDVITGLVSFGSIKIMFIITSSGSSSNSSILNWLGQIFRNT